MSIKEKGEIPLKEKKKKVNLIKIIQWIAFVLLLISGTEIMKKAFFEGLFTVLLGFAISPLFSFVYRGKKKSVKVISCLAMMILAIVSVPSNETPTKSDSFFDENGERAYFPTTTAAETTETDTTTTTATTSATTTTTETTTAAETTTETTTEIVTTTAEPTTKPQKNYVVNTSSGKIHNPYCSSVDDISPSNRMDYTGNFDDLTASGYTACKRCNPY